MHPSQSPFFDIKGHICLCDDRLQPMCLKFFLAKGARKETSRILTTLNIYDVSTFELRPIENHYRSSSPHKIIHYLTEELPTAVSPSPASTFQWFAVERSSFFLILSLTASILSTPSFVADNGPSEHLSRPI